MESESHQIHAGTELGIRGREEGDRQKIKIGSQKGKQACKTYSVCFPTTGLCGKILVVDCIIVTSFIPTTSLCYVTFQFFVLVVECTFSPSDFGLGL